MRELHGCAGVTYWCWSYSQVLNHHIVFEIKYSVAKRTDFTRYKLKFCSIFFFNRIFILHPIRRLSEKSLIIYIFLNYCYSKNKHEIDYYN